MIIVTNNKLDLSYDESNFESFGYGQNQLKFYDKRRKETSEHLKIPNINPSKQSQYNFILNGKEYEAYIIEDGIQNLNRKHWFSSEEDLKTIKEIRRATIIAPKLELVGLNREAKLHYLVTYTGKHLYFMLWMSKLESILDKIFNTKRIYTNPRILALIQETQQLKDVVPKSLQKKVKCYVVSTKVQKLKPPLDIEVNTYDILGEIDIQTKVLIQYTTNLLINQNFQYCLIPTKGSFICDEQNNYSDLSYTQSDNYYFIHPKYQNLDNRIEFKDLWYKLSSLEVRSSVKEFFENEDVSLENYLQELINLKS